MIMLPNNKIVHHSSLKLPAIGYWVYIAVLTTYVLRKHNWRLCFRFQEQLETGHGENYLYFPSRVPFFFFFKLFVLLLALVYMIEKN